MDYIDLYNNHRLHSLLDHKTPEEHEAAYFQGQVSAGPAQVNAKSA